MASLSSMPLTDAVKAANGAFARHRAKADASATEYKAWLVAAFMQLRAEFFPCVSGCGRRGGRAGGVGPLPLRACSMAHQCPPATPSPPPPARRESVNAEPAPAAAESGGMEVEVRCEHAREGRGSPPPTPARCAGRVLPPVTPRPLPTPRTPSPRPVCAQAVLGDITNSAVPSADKSKAAMGRKRASDQLEGGRVSRAGLGGQAGGTGSGRVRAAAHDAAERWGWVAPHHDRRLASPPRTPTPPPPLSQEPEAAAKRARRSNDSAHEGAAPAADVPAAAAAAAQAPVAAGEAAEPTEEPAPVAAAAVAAAAPAAKPAAKGAKARKGKGAAAATAAAAAAGSPPRGDAAAATPDAPPTTSSSAASSTGTGAEGGAAPVVQQQAPAGDEAGLAEQLERLLEAVAGGKLADVITAWQPALLGYAAAQPAAQPVQPLHAALHAFHADAAAFFVAVGCDPRAQGAIPAASTEVCDCPTSGLAATELWAALRRAQTAAGATSRSKKVKALVALEPILGPAVATTREARAAAAAHMQALSGGRGKAALPAFAHLLAPLQEPEASPRGNGEDAMGEPAAPPAAVAAAPKTPAAAAVSPAPATRASARRVGGSPLPAPVARDRKSVV